MAVIDPTFEPGRAGSVKVTWAALGAADTGKPVSLKRYPEKVVQIFGTFDTTTLTLQWSNDPRADPDNVDHASAVWATMPDAQGNDIAKTAAAGEQMLDSPVDWIRPLSAGGASTALTVIVTAEKKG